MANMASISTVIITFNEADNIAACIESATRVSDEIIVVDSFSTDNTVQIASDLGAIVFQNEFKGHIEQKNFAVSCAKNDWILSLDADERCSEEMINAILAEKSNFHEKAYQFNRLNNYCGQWIKHGGWYPDRKVRLWHKENGNWGGTNPHDEVILHNLERPKQLKGNILHYSYHSYSEHLAQNNKFSSISAKALFMKGKTVGLLKLIVNPTFRFLREYVFKLGFLDGLNGFVIAINNAHLVFMKYAKLKELTKSQETKKPT